MLFQVPLTWSKKLVFEQILGFWKRFFEKDLIAFSVFLLSAMNDTYIFSWSLFAIVWTYRGGGGS